MAQKVEPYTIHSIKLNGGLYISVSSTTHVKVIIEGEANHRKNVALQKCKSDQKAYCDKGLPYTFLCYANLALNGIG